MHIITNSDGHTLLQLIETDESTLPGQCQPLTHSLIVAEHAGKFLFVFNTWKRHWELPGGIIEDGEHPKECAVRELAEETNQAAELQFKGIMKLRLKPDDHIEYGALYTCRIDEPTDFVPNSEVDRIVFWDLCSDIGIVDEIDRKLVDFYER